MSTENSFKAKEPSEYSLESRQKLVLITIVLLSIGMGVVLWSNAGNRFPIRYVRIIGSLENINLAELQNVLELVSDQGILDVNLAVVHDVSQQMEWIEKVNVRRVWPDTLELQVIEHIPYARWGSNGLLSDKGVLFEPGDLEEFIYLPKLEVSNQSQKQWVGHLHSLNQKLAVYKMGIASLHVESALGWSAILLNGITVVMGRKQPLIVFDRFLKALALMEEKEIAAMKRIDLRYPQGFTVEWDSTAVRRWSQQSNDSQGYQITKHKVRV